MQIRYNGHSSFTLFAKDGTTIVMDPYEPGSFGGGLGYVAIDSDPDIVTISHDHADHNYINDFSGDFEVVRGGGKAGGIEFFALTVYHDENEGQDRGEINILSFTFEKIRFCHLGDIGHVLSDDQLKILGQVDVLFIPVGGFYTIDANQATDIVERLQPKIAIPMHYKTEKCGFPIAEVSEFIKDKKNVQEIPADTIEIEPDKLPGETEILVLKHRL